MKKSLRTLFLILTVGITLYASDVILSNTLGAYYCAQEPNPKTYIKHTVEEPISIYWEDNIYPGFDDADAELMVKNYLDGVHLQTMALNTPDGKVKIYSYANVPKSYIDLLNELETVKKEMLVKEKVFNQARGYKKEYGKYPSDFNQTRDAYLLVMNKSIELAKQLDSARAKLPLETVVTTHDQMPQMNYTVKSDEVHLSDLASKVLYSDEVKITDNRTGELIAYDRRIMQLFSAAFLPDFAIGMRYYVPDALCGQEKGGFFEGRIFTTLESSTTRRVGLNQMLYKKYTK